MAGEPDLTSVIAIERVPDNLDALAVDERVLGPDTPDTGGALNNLANLLWAQGELTAARPLLERALAIFERVLGPDHPDTARIRANLEHVPRKRK